MPLWYCLQTQPHAEQQALRNLANQGFDGYLPQYLKQRRHARRVDWVRAPLFPRYLFVALDLAAQGWRSIRSTVGVRQLVCLGEAPTPVPPPVIEAIRAREDEAGLIRLDQAPQFRRDEPVQVLAGAFADQVGLFQCASDRDRVMILLNVLGRSVRVRLPAEVVCACA